MPDGMQGHEFLMEGGALQGSSAILGQSKQQDEKPEVPQLQARTHTGASPLGATVLSKKQSKIWRALQTVGRGDDALLLHQHSQDPTALLNLIKTCGSQKDLHTGSIFHAYALKTGLIQEDIYVGTALIRMYAKCGALTKAQEVFNELLARDVASWNALISGYAQYGLGHEALNCFGQMQEEGLSPNAITFVCILKACGSIGFTKLGEEIHVEAGRQGLLEKNVVLGTAIVDMYVKCRAFAKAQEVFDGLPVRDVVSWNVLIAGYAQHGLSDEVVICFQRMRDEGLSPNAVTFVCILKACGSIKAAKMGEEIHAEVDRQGLLKNNIVLGTALVDMYAKCGMLEKAQNIFNEFSARDVASWNSLIAGYVQHDLNDEALNCFQRMQNEGFSPNAVTFTCILKACGSKGAADKGEEIHAEVGRQGLLEKDIVLGTALVDMYAKCGAIAKAQVVFDGFPARDVASWTALIAGYAQHQLGNEALMCFEHMRDEGLSPNAVTFACILNACGSIGAIDKGEEIHVEVGRQGLLEKSIVLGTALVDMYAKCGMLAKAQEVFNELPARDVACWTALMAGYAQHGHTEEALSFFTRMRDQGLSPDTETFLCILRSCGSIGATEKGEEIHSEIGRRGLLEEDTVLGIALVDMYAKCGALAKAQEVFDKLPARDVVSWTVLIAGYAQLGMARRVFHSFSKMIGDCIEPNVVTFVVLLNACSHAGLVEEGQMYFDIMSTVYCIIPTLEHYTCMVDLFSRAGILDKAISVIQKVPSSDRLLLWLTLLGACGKWVNVKLGRFAFEHAVQLDEKYAAAYVGMNNIYAATGMQVGMDDSE